MIAFWLPFWILAIIGAGVIVVLTFARGSTPMGRHRLNRTLHAQEMAAIEEWLARIEGTRAGRRNDA